MAMELEISQCETLSYAEEATSQLWREVWPIVMKWCKTGYESVRSHRIYTQVWPSVHRWRQEDCVRHKLRKADLWFLRSYYVALRQLLYKKWMLVLDARMESINMW